MTSSEEAVRTAIAQQAGDWFVANETGHLSDAESAAFLAWLKASPIHIEEYLGVARIARHARAALGEPQVPLEVFLVQALADDTSVVALEAAADAQKPRALEASWRVWQIAASVAALAVLAAGVLWWAHDGELLGLPRSYQTAHGEDGMRRLPDGSILRLDTDSAVTVRYSGRERVVEVDRGQAFFDVARDTRRFRVTVNDAGAIAVGTRFDVYRQTGTTIVTVAEGQVAVYAGEPPGLYSDGGIPTNVQRVKAGYQVRIDAGVMPTQPVPVDLDQTLAWLQHKIVFKHRPLGEVAAEFNRYAHIPLEIEESTLAVLPVSGNFDAGDTDSFIAFLEKLPGVAVDRTTQRIRIWRIAPAT